MNRIIKKEGFSPIIVVAIGALLFTLVSIIFFDWKYEKSTEEIDLSNSILPKNSSKRNYESDDFVVIEVGISTASTTAELVKRTHGIYEDYQPELLPTPVGTEALFFFYAGWDQLSRDLDMSISTYIDRLPARIVLIKTDFEKREALRTKYGVSNVNTFVLTDRSGKLIKKWSNSKTIDDIIDELDNF